MSRPSFSTPPADRHINLEFPVSDFAADAGRVAFQAGSAIIETPHSAGGYGALTRLPDALRLLFDADPALVRARLKVEEGAVEIGILNERRTGFLDRKEVSAQDGRTADIVLGIPRLGNASDVVIMGTTFGTGKVRVESLSLTVLPKGPSERMMTVDLALNDLVKEGGQTSVGLANATLDTPAVGGAYVVQLPLPSGLRRFYSVVPALIRVRLRVERGHLDLGVLNRDGSAFVDRQQVSAGDERTRDVVLAIPHLGNASDVVFMGSSSGTGRVRIENISLIFYSTLPRNGFLNLEVPLSDFTMAGGDGVKSDAATIEIATTPGAYSAHLPLPESLRLVYSGEPALISVRLRARGAAGIGVLNQDESDFLDRKPLTPDERMRTIYLGLDNISDASKLVVYGGPPPLGSRVQIEKVSITL